ncbi:unnamed protein product [Zymoseptoria tritici ST99CH_3D1]|uniref:Uncharacterized protein n=1 Tax=Zymoseptoria tritici (strain CBS 115943 / IPO323) TaxID=336722 RepID=F9WXR4_ZYMTI|nr:uncharacterized protein MYCGRDRAFT_89072 [Zymoseptoria tritici IPO323]EGP91074.1 hypothetical protein MYCGRDRAFT_89072 [Zymoseptoria tritici IPO323]SMR44008.1 unnamed protein product [Zymoseptoria tritici ST99CH_3D1]
MIPGRAKNHVELAELPDDELLDEEIALVSGALPSDAEIPLPEQYDDFIRDEDPNKPRRRPKAPGDSKKSPELNSADGDAPEVIDVDALPALPKHNRIAVLSGHPQANGSKSTANKSQGGKSTASNTTASKSATRDVMAGSLFQSNLMSTFTKTGSNSSGAIPMLPPFNYTDTALIPHNMEKQAFKTNKRFAEVVAHIPNAFATPSITLEDKKKLLLALNEEWKHLLKDKKDGISIETHLARVKPMYLTRVVSMIWRAMRCEEGF